MKKWKGKIGKIEVILIAALLATASLTILTFVVLPHVESPVKNAFFNSIDMLSSNEGWIVGRIAVESDNTPRINGIILRWDGVNWYVVENSVENAWFSSRFNSVDMLSSNEGWAVGQGKTILRWDGVSWSVIESPVENAWFNSIDMLSSNEVWIVGGIIHWWNGTSENGTILRWDGTSWSLVERSLSYGSLSSVDMLSSNEGWAVGPVGTILRWDGVSWSVIESPVKNAFFNSINMLSSNEVWIVGGMIVESDYTPRINGIILRWDGVSWSVIENPVENAWFSSWFDSVDMLSSNEGWIVGGTSKYGIILRWDGVSWSEVESPVENAWFNSIDMLSSDEGWIVGGTSRYGTILRWDGTRWSVFEPPTYEWLHWTFTGITIAIAVLLLVVLYRKRRLAKAGG